MDGLPHSPIPLFLSPPVSQERQCEVTAPTQRSLIVIGPQPSILTSDTHVLHAEALLPGTLGGLFLGLADFHSDILKWIGLHSAHMIRLDFP